MFIVQNPALPAAIRNAIVDLIAPDMTELRVASAYSTFSGSDLLLSAIADKVGGASLGMMPKTLVTSFDFGLTEPQALRAWLELPNTRIFVSGAQQLMQRSLIPQRAFHPKLYMFGSASGGYNSLVGSANLTGRGLTVNIEAAWAQYGVPRADIDAVFALAQFETVELTGELLATYEALRRVQPPPAGFNSEVQPVEPPRLPPGELQQFRLAIECGQINPEHFNAMWVQGDALQGGSRNQLELPRGAHRFFGFNFGLYEYHSNLTIGHPIIRSGASIWGDRPLTWHGNNRMERMNLPTINQGGFDYTGTAIMFRRLYDGSFELIVTPWESDLARAWRQAAIQQNTLFRLGAALTNRTVGLL
ncbi:phospholipase D family protein [Burkholderia ubonensis]|uniref:phospholipase D family protein n=1 Tax=Burkholderia ubonensis TaxID=101571 RepID=UPI0009B338FB|nr:phospholipase D family protein [Burkholderia ubonensis]